MYPTIITDRWIDLDIPEAVLDSWAFSNGGNSKGDAAAACFMPSLFSE